MTRASAPAPRPSIALLTLGSAAPETGGEFVNSRIEEFLGLNFTVKRFPIDQMPESFRRFRLLLNLYVLWRILRLRPDVVLEDASVRPAVFLANWPLRLLGIRVVLSVQDLMFDATGPRWRRWASDIQTWLFLHSASTVIANSRYLAAEIEGFQVFSDRIKVLPPPGNLPTPSQSRIHVHGPDETPVILCVGNLRSIKGQDLLLEAAAQLREERFTLRFVGAVKENLFAARLKARAAELGLTERVEFTGAKHGHELQEEYRRADIFALPSRYESRGMVIQEAFGYGLPIVASAVGGVAESVIDHQNGLLAPPGDVASLGRAILELIRSPQLRQRLGTNGRRQAEGSPTWAEFCSAFSDLIFELEAPSSDSISKTALRACRVAPVWLLDRYLRRISKRGLVPSGGVQTVLIQRMTWNGLGDILVTEPLLRCIREAFPGSKIVMLTSRLGKQVLENQGLVDSFFICDQDDLDRMSLLDRITMGLKLRASRPDIAISSTKDTWLWHGLLIFLSGAPLRIGFEESSGRGFYNRRVPLDRSKHEADRNLDLARVLGIAVPLPLPRYRIDPYQRAALTQRLSRTGLSLVPGEYFVVHLSGKRPTRSWTCSAAAEVVRSLARIGRPVLLTGEPKDLTAIDKVRRLSGGQGNVQCVVDLTLGTFAALLGGSRFVISVDTGPMHMGVAVGAPVIAIFGPGDATKWAYSLPTFRTIHNKLSCNPCYLTECFHHTCMRSVDPEQVLAAADQFQNRRSPTGFPGSAGDGMFSKPADSRFNSTNVALENTR